jgi:hypothetical protein
MLMIKKMCTLKNMFAAAAAAWLPAQQLKIVLSISVPTYLLNVG